MRIQGFTRPIRLTSHLVPDLLYRQVETSSKRYINIKQNYKFFFQSFDEDFGLVKEEITNDNNILPKTQEGKIVCFLTPGEEPKVIYMHVGSLDT